MFRVNNVMKVYSQGEQSMTALSDITLEFEKHGFVSIVGESGSGKTTLLNVLAGFDKVTKGEIYFQDKETSSYSEEEWNSYYSEDVGFIFQEYNVIEELTVWDNVALPLEILDISIEKKLNMIKSVLNKVGLCDVMEKQVSKLSGGQKQRVAIARAYVKKPKVILADEPTGNLDYENSIKIFEMLKDISKDTLVIVVTHNQRLGKKYSDRMIKLADGRVVSDTMLTKEKYDIKICNGDVQEQIEDFSDITSFVMSYPNKENQYTIRVEKIETEDSRSEIVSYTKEKYDKKNLQNRKIIALSRKILSKRRMRQILSVGIFVITIFLLLTIMNITFYNENTVVSDYLKKYQEQAVLVEYKLDSLYTYAENGNIAYVTKEIKQYLANISKSDMFYQFNSVELSNGDNMGELDAEQEEKEFSILSDARVLSDKILSEIYSIEGLKGQEFVITEALAQEAGIFQDDIGKLFFVNGKKLVLKGIVQEEQQFIFFSELYIETMKEDNSHKNISVNGNFFNSKSLVEYANSFISIGNIDRIEYTELIGSIPKSDNEVVLSYDFVYENIENKDVVENLQSIIGETYNLKNLHSEEYGNALSEKMNLYDYLGKEILVVGIADFDGDVLVEQNAYQKISEEYYSVYRYDRMGCYGDKWDDIVRSLHEKGLKISDDSLKNVYMLVDMKPVLIKYIVFIFIIMVILTIFLMISLIGYSIKDNSKVIGILYAIGINKKDIKKIFMIEPIKVMIISFSTAIVLLIMVIEYINIEYCKSLIGKTYEILPISIPSILIVLIVTMLIGIIMVIFPLKEMEKKTIIETIRD